MTTLGMLIYLTSFISGYAGRCAQFTRDILSTLLTPKESELIAAPYRYEGSAELAREHFREGFNDTFNHLKSLVNPDFPMTVYYAFKQAEADNEAGDQRASTGWETMLEGLISAGFQVTGTLPVRTTKKARSVARGTNALASAIVLVCRPRSDNCKYRNPPRPYVCPFAVNFPMHSDTYKAATLLRSDFAQAAIGPGMGVFSRLPERPLKRTGIRCASGLPYKSSIVNLTSISPSRRGDLDPDTRFCIAWFEQHNMEGAAFGEADVLARAKNSSVEGIAESGVLQASVGRVRLLSRDEYSDDWDPASD